MEPIEADGQIIVKPKTAAQEAGSAVLKELARLGGNLTTEDALEFRGKKIVLPESMSGDVSAAIKWLKEHQEQQEQKHIFRRVFKYRPLDGAHAFHQVLKKVWGNTGLGKPINTMFGPIPPAFITIDVGVNETAQVPQNRIDFPPLQAEIYCEDAVDPELGPLFELIIEAPRKFRGHIEGLFIAIEQELQHHSIYKGKAITGATVPAFIDTSKVDPDKVVYSQETLTQLGANVWSVLRHGEEMKKLGISLKRAVLLEGPFGTGKTLAAFLTAQEAVKAGWTFVFCRPGVDDLDRTMKTALLYAPSVVFFEDIDVLAERGDPEAVQKLLDTFDGIGAKNQDCIAVLTTNHVDKIHRGMLRPGRLDAVIHIGELDASGIERLIRVKVPEDRLGELKMDEVWDAMKGFLPAFAAEAIDRAMRYQIHRTGALGKLETTDFVAAALGLRPQLDLMEGAGEGQRTPTLDAVIHKAVRGAVHEMVLVDRSGGRSHQLDGQGDPVYAAK
jgi:transitional endoplasmic reticulum ATPase